MFVQEQSAWKAGLSLSDPMGLIVTEWQVKERTQEVHTHHDSHWLASNCRTATPGAPNTDVSGFKQKPCQGHGWCMHLCGEFSTKVGQLRSASVAYHDGVLELTAKRHQGEFSALPGLDVEMDSKGTLGMLDVLKHTCTTGES